MDRDAARYADSQSRLYSPIATASRLVVDTPCVGDWRLPRDQPMSGSRKKPGWAFWTTVAVLGLALYVASTGPSDYLFSHGYLSETNASLLHSFYSPFAWGYRHSPGCVQRAYDAYSLWWSKLPPTERVP